MAAEGGEGDVEIIYAPEIVEAMAKDPKLAEQIRSTSAAFRQAAHGIEAGLYKDMDEAIAKITGGNIKPLQKATEDEE